MYVGAGFLLCYFGLCGCWCWGGGGVVFGDCDVDGIVWICYLFVGL